MRISELKVKNFKAFYGDEPYLFDFLGEDEKAKNILLYGENGSGKSSLYWLLHHVLTSSSKETFNKYQNIFAKKEGKPIEIEMSFDNGKNFHFDGTTTTLDTDTQDEFKRLSNIKTFLTYDNIFLVNELFNKNISVERFVYILDVLYGESLHDELEKYKKLRQKFKRDYQKKICNFRELFREFEDEYNIAEYWNSIYESGEYEDIPKWDKEENKAMEPFYETIYYFSTETIATFQVLKSHLEAIRDIFGVKSKELEAILDGMEDFESYLEDKSEEYYEDQMKEEKIFVTDFEAIETVNALDDMLSYFSELSQMVLDYEEAKAIVDSLNSKLKAKINQQVDFINDILKNNFKSKIEIENIALDYLLFDVENLDKFFPIKYKIKTADEVLTNRYSKFFNEAKISSINFAFYISIIKSYAELKELKLLVLDDLLISLDMSNRDIVLGILEEYFSDYQIILLTHDKAFFEMAKMKLNKKEWKQFEMYVDDKGDFEKPFILPHRDYFEKAEYFFLKHDYSACANYLRKEAERLLKALVCHHRDLSCEETKNLQTLIDKVKTKGSLKEKENIVERVRKLIEFEEFEKLIEFDLSQLPTVESKKTIGTIRTELKRFKEFSTQEIEALSETLIMLEEFKSLIFNPQSHDDMKVPLYKKELEEAKKVIEKLRDSVESSVVIAD